MAQKKASALREENRLKELESRFNELKLRSAITIQTHWRRHLIVKRRNEILNEEQKVARASRVVQKVLIGWRVRKEFLVKRNAAKTIQVRIKIQSTLEGFLHLSYKSSGGIKTMDLLRGSPVPAAHSGNRKTKPLAPSHIF